MAFITKIILHVLIIIEYIFEYIVGLNWSIFYITFLNLRRFDSSNLINFSIELPNNIVKWINFTTIFGFFISLNLLLS